MKKTAAKVLAAIIILVIGVSVIAYFVNNRNSQQPSEITILHTNDTHANVSDDGKGTIGFAKFVTFVNDLRGKDENVIVLDAGDMFQGLPFANLEQGRSIIDLVNAVGYDAMAVGNHEFDFGSANLLEIKEQLDFPMLAANIYMEDGAKVFRSYIVKELSGVKVGVFGISTPETAYKTHPDNVKGYVFTDMIEEAQKAVNELRNEEKADVVIMLSHLGLYEGDYTSDLIAEAVEGIDVIVDGHSHTELPEGLVVNQTLIASTGTAFNNIGVIDLTVEKGQVVEKSAGLLNYDALAEVSPDPHVLAKIDELTVKQDEALNQVIGETAAVLEGEREIVRTSETNLGQLITDAMLNLTGADVALMNGGGIRASIDAGEITMKEIITVLPFGNTIIVKEVAGKDLLAALEHSVSEYPNEKGGFLHTAGMTFTFDPSQEVGKRISNVKIDGKALEPGALYTVAMSDFIAAGGDDFTMFSDYKVQAEYNTLMDCLTDYIKSAGTVQGQYEVRMTVVSENTNDKAA